MEVAREIVETVTDPTAMMGPEVSVYNSIESFEAFSLVQCT